MDTIVVLRQVPDLVEDLEFNAEGTDLDRDVLKYVLNEFDDWALEQALLLKEQHGGSITAVALDLPEADNALYTALAKGADRAVKIVGDFPLNLSNHAMAKMLAGAVRSRPHGLVLTGVQSAEDLDGQISVLLAAHLGYPVVGVVTDVALDGGTLVVHKEFAGGLLAELEVDRPCVLGIQAARRPPRYAPISRVRAVMKEKKIEQVPADAVDDGGVTIRAFRKPESSRHAEMVEGDPDTVADRILDILRERGVVKR